MINGIMQGTRLAFVVRKIKGKVKRNRITIKTIESKVKGKADRHEMITEPVDKEAGFMVYFPRGHALRLDEAGLARYGLDKEPEIVNLTGLHDPNSPAGKLFYAQEEGARKAAFQDLEQQVIDLVTHKVGPNLITRDLPEEATA